MKELFHVELYLDSSYALDEQKAFIFKSRCICNYLERGLETLKFKSPFSRLNIHCSKTSDKDGVRPLEHEAFLEAHILYDVQHLNSSDEKLLQCEFANIILSGLGAAQKFTSMPVEECRLRLDEFKNEGFVNRWVQVDKYWKKWDCRCVIEAEITTTHFILTEFVHVGGRLVASLEIAKTKPREMLFEEYLGSASLSSSGILSYKAGGAVRTVFSVEEIRFI